MVCWKDNLLARVVRLGFAFPVLHAGRIIISEWRCECFDVAEVVIFLCTKFDGCLVAGGEKEQVGAARWEDLNIIYIGYQFITYRLVF